MPSSVTEEDVLKLREAKFLTAEIPHRLPAQGQAIPSPQPGESVHVSLPSGVRLPDGSLREGAAVLLRAGIS